MQTKWIGKSGGKASDPSNWDNGVPAWNNRAVWPDTTERIEIDWDLKSISTLFDTPPDNIIIYISSVCLVDGRFYVPDALIGYHKPKIDISLDLATLDRPPPGYGMFRVEDKTWDGGGVDFKWSTNENWSGDTKPALGDNIIFDGTVSNNDCAGDEAVANYGTLTIRNGYTGTITCKVVYQFNGAASITSNATWIAAENTTYFASTLVINSATAVVKADANYTIQIDGTISLANGTLGVADTAFILDINGSLNISSGDLIAPNAAGTFTFAGLLWTDTGGFTHSSGTVTFNRGGISTMLGSHATDFNNVVVSDGGGLDLDTFNFTTAGTMTVGTGTSGIVHTSTGTKTINGTFTINAGGSFGTAATAYTLDVNGTLAVSAGTLIAPNATGLFTFSGVTWNTPTIFTNSTGEVGFDIAGTTSLANDSTQFYGVWVNDGATLATLTYEFTTADYLWVGTGATGNFTATSGAKTVGDLLYMDLGASMTCGTSTLEVADITDCHGTFNGGSGTNQFDDILTIWPTCVWTATTSITYCGDGLNISGTFVHNNGNVTLKSETIASILIDFTTGGTHFYDITMTNNTIGTKGYTVSGNVFIDNDFIITTTRVILDCATNNPNLEFAGDVTFFATSVLSPGTGTWTFNGVVNQNVVLPTGSITFGNVIVQAAAEVTIGMIIMVTGMQIGVITMDQSGTDVLTVGDLTVTGILHAVPCPPGGAKVATPWWIGG